MPRLIADLLRVLATLAVITIHATDAWRLAPGTPDSTGAWAAVITDQLCRFCVPLFVLLSGYALGKRYGSDATFTTGEFLRRRATRIGVPYLLWAGLNLAVLTAIGILHWHKPWQRAFGDCFHDGAGNPIGVLHWLAIGGADYHLYFLPIILQCYVLFPLVRSWRPGLGAMTALAIGLLGWTIWQEGSRIAGWPFPPLWSTFPLPWVLIFLLGHGLAIGESSIHQGVQRLPTAWAAIILASGPLACILDWWWAVGHGVRGEYAGDFSRPAAPWYACCLVFAALRWGSAWERRLAPIAGWITAIAAASFATYLAHTWILRGLEWTGIRGAGRAVWVPTAILASLLVGHGLSRLAARWRPLGWLIGS